MSHSNDVTYADLRFGKSPPEKSRHEEPKEGELTYENIWGPRAQEKEQAPRRAEGAREWNHWTRKAALAMLAASLFLLATTVGLGIRYWQVSGQLQRASQDHADHSSSLARRVSTQEESLAEMEGRLHQAQAELSSTRLDLRESRAATERTQKQLREVEEGLREANRSLEALKREKQETEAELHQATSCQQMGCCPPEWKLFRWKCLWISLQASTWWQSQKDCERKSSQLLVLKKPWDAKELWEAMKVMGSLQVNDYWIGLRRTWSTEKNPGGFLWADGSDYEGSKNFYQYPYHGCVKVTNGNLGQGDCSYSYLRYICEMAASPAQPVQAPGHY